MSQARTPTPHRRRPAVAGRRGAEATPSPKPRPEPEAADEDIVETDVVETDVVESGDVETERVETGVVEAGVVEAGVAGPRRRRLVLALSVALAVFTGIAVAAGIAAAPSSDDDLRNTALTDAAATSDLLGQVNKAVETVFSFDFTDTAKTQAAAQNLLRDRAVEQYNQLFEQVRQLAPAQKLVLTTTIRATSVIRLEGDQAQLLVLADQRSTRGDTNQTSNAAAQLTVTAKKSGDTWTIGELTVL